ncbi:hypothetical protein TNCV_1347201 [Trichonephila clavipes]|nr:hypothetical protein TNCV_1347201 [Trichonephila clavipes]
MLNDDVIVTSVQAESDPANDEKDEDEDNNENRKGPSNAGTFSAHNMLTKYQMIKFIDFCEVWFLPESVGRVAAIVGDHRCHTPRH